MIHTVFSKDIHDESGEPEEADSVPEVEPAGVSFLGAAAHEAGSHSEINLSLLSDSNDRKSSKPLFSKIAYADLVQIIFPPQSPHSESYFQVLLSSVLISDVPARAPPSLSL